MQLAQLTAATLDALRTIYQDSRLELVLKTNLIGTEEMVRERAGAHRHAGVNILQVLPDGETLDERLATLARLVELVKEINAES